MLQAGKYYQLNTWPFGTKHVHSSAHVRDKKNIFHVLFIETPKQLPENTGFNVFIKTVIPGKIVEAQIVKVANEFEMNEREKRYFKGLNLELQID